MEKKKFNINWRIIQNITQSCFVIEAIAVEDEVQVRKYINFIWSLVRWLSFFSTLIVLLVIGIVQAGATQSSFTRNCTVSYLQSFNYLDDLQPVPKEDSCDFQALTASTVSKINNAIRTLTKSDFETDPECIGKNMQNKSLERQILLKKVYIESTHLTKEEKEQKLQQVNEKMETILFDAMSSCDKVKEIFERFPSKESSVDSTINMFELFCVKKFTVDGNFLNISSYAVNYTDPSIDESGIDCADAIAINRMAMDYQIEQQDFTDDQTSCIITKNHEIQYFEHFAWIETMLIAKVDEVSIIKEREHFKNFYLKSLQNIFNCVLENWESKSILLAGHL